MSKIVYISFYASSCGLVWSVISFGGKLSERGGRGPGDLSLKRKQSSSLLSKRIEKDQILPVFTNLTFLHLSPSVKEVI